MKNKKVRDYTHSHKITVDKPKTERWAKWRYIRAQLCCHLGQMLAEKKCTSVWVLIFVVDIDVTSNSAEFKLPDVSEEGKEGPEYKCKNAVFISGEETCDVWWVTYRRGGEGVWWPRPWICLMIQPLINWLTALIGFYENYTAAVGHPLSLLLWFICKCCSH